MFFKQIFRNSARSRKDNGLFFGSLVVAIVAFYTLLSLGDQDVMLFLQEIESDAVSKIMRLIPIVYIVSLFFVFFLVYFAYRYQLSSRRREFGLYLMFGMKRKRLFFMLIGETFWNSLISLVIGLPIALFLTEAISLATAKLVGLGIIGHQISLSIPAVLAAALGFLAVQTIAMIFLSSQVCSKEPADLLRTDAAEKQIAFSAKKGSGTCFCGILFLIMAYGVGVTKFHLFHIGVVLAVFILGILGTFLFYRGIGSVIGSRIQKKSKRTVGLFTFTGRQIQEQVLYEYKSLAISSLLLMCAIALVSFGISVASGHGLTDTRTADFSLKGDEEMVEALMNKEENAALVSAWYPMHISSSYENVTDMSWQGFIDALMRQPESRLRNNLTEYMADRSDVYLISETSYNELLESLGKEPLRLKENEAALYTTRLNDNSFAEIINGALESGGTVQLESETRELRPEIYSDNVVTDRTISLYMALIVTQKDYETWGDSSEPPLCWNVLLNNDIIEKEGLIQAIRLFEESLIETDLEYETYITGLGRNLFYTVSASYLTIYLGVLFMIIANTVIGLKFLMQQRITGHRYVTMFKLGAQTDILCKSARKQIILFFSLAISLAVCSSVFAVWSMFNSFLNLPVGSSVTGLAALALAAFLIMFVIEIIYILLVMRTSTREIRNLQEIQKGDL